MIPWLIQTPADYSETGLITHPAGFLHPVEQQKLAGFKIEKRRQDWLLGRWTAKRLMQDYLARTTGQYPASSELVIANSPDGAPFVSLSTANGAQLRRLPLCLSISHSGDHALAALWAEAMVGTDIEQVERRPPSFVNTFFTEEEIAHLALLDDTLRAETTTIIWSAKESVLKAMRLGLRVDTRQVNCLPAFATDVSAWTLVRVRLAAPLAARLGDNVLSTWWRPYGAYVITLAMLSQAGMGIGAHHQS
jgi:4'-phosphopantetheinyl transferase